MFYYYVNRFAQKLYFEINYGIDLHGWICNLTFWQVFWSWRKYLNTTVTLLAIEKRGSFFFLKNNNHQYICPRYEQEQLIGAKVCTY